MAHSFRRAPLSIFSPKVLTFFNSLIFTFSSGSLLHINLFAINDVKTLLQAVHLLT